MIKQWLTDEFTLTKWHLGVLMIGAGIALAAVMVLAELIGTKSSGLGAIQWFGIGGGAVSVLVGLTLLPLGNQSA